MEDLMTTAEQKLPTKTLTELKVEIKFHLGQMAGHAVEIGRLLIEAKKQVGHGNFGKWLEDNFNLKERSARRFMQVADRFGKTDINVRFQSTQLIAMLALPEGEEEKFIAEKSAEGTPVETMKVKNLREEVAKWKADFEKQKSEVENLFSEKTVLESDKKRLSEERDKMQKKLEEVAENSATLQSKNAELQEQLKNQKPIEVQVPADYEKNKKQLADLQAKLAETTSRAEIFQKIDAVCLLWKDIFQSKIGSAIFAEYEKIKPNRYNEFVGSVSDFFKNNGIL